jgi:RHS repeat-associated protein
MTALSLTRRAGVMGLLQGILFAAFVGNAAAQSDKIPGMSLGQFKVSNNGSATYSIGIIVPPGINGLQPKISLSYDSQSGNGLLGVGWSLGGLSAIHRCPRTIVQDNFKGTINYDANDRFCMDGQRLMVINNMADGADQAEYRTELDTFIRIFSYGVAGIGPDHFIVKNKTGETLEFGNDALGKSRIEAQGKTSVRVWALNKITDASGNYLTVTYEEDSDNGDYRPSRIDYTGNVGQGASTRRYVQFLYDSRTQESDIPKAYIGGSIVKTTQRLSKIQTYAPDPSLPPDSQPVLVREYRLAYDFSGALRSRITSIAECGGSGPCTSVTEECPPDDPCEPIPCLLDGSCLPPTRFTWQPVSRALGMQTWNGNNFVADGDSTAKFNLVGDFTGDGKSDIISKASSGCAAHLSNGAGFDRPPNWSCNLDSNGYNWVGDFNGDGKADILSKSGSTCKLHISTGTNFNIIPNVACTLNGSKIRWNFVGDFDGDGRTDIVSKSGNDCALNISTGTGFTTTTIPCAINGHDTLNLNYVGDFDGDGKADILARIGSASGTAAGCNMNLSTDAGFTTTHWDCSLDQNGFNYVGDFNGDGKTDTLNVNGNGPHAVSLSTGTGFVTSSWGVGINGSGYNWVGDFDGDGKADIVAKGGSNCTVHYSTGAGFINITQPCSTDAGSFNYVGDFTGDGRADLLQVISPNQAKLNVPSGSFPDPITRIDNNLGGNVNIFYKPITDSTVYTKDTDALYPVVDLQAPIYVVDNHVASNGTGQSFQFTYDYGGAKMHALGRGWLGFRWMRVQDETAKVEASGQLKTRITSFFRQVKTPSQPDFPLIGMLTFAETADTGGAIFSQVNSAYAIKDTQPGLTLPPPTNEPRVRFPALTRTDNSECDGQQLCLQTAVEYIYDTLGPSGATLGNQTRVLHRGQVTSKDDTSFSGDEFDETTEWAVNSTTWAHRPFHTTVNRLDPPNGASTLLREKFLYYDNQPLGTLGDRALLTKEESRLTGGAGDPGNPTLTHGYDGFGNRTSTTNPIGCPTTTTLDANTHTFPATVTNCLGHTTTFTWDARFGVKLTETDPNSQLTTYTFDSYGRPITVVGPKDSPEFPTIAISYINWVDPVWQVIQTDRRINHLGPGVIRKLDYFDGLGRFDFIRSTGPNDPTTGQSRLIVEQSIYDSRGLIIQKIPAHFDNEPPLPFWEYLYDVLGRQIRVDHPDVRFATTLYEPGKVTLTDERGKQKIKHLDAYGRVIQIDEKNNNGADTYITTYEYDAIGTLIHVVNHLGHNTRIKYDPIGRKIAMCDPNMGAGPNVSVCDTTTPGAWVYSYDKAGNLLTQTDAKNQTLTFDYDLGSRVRHKSSSAGTITYTYDDPLVNFSKGRLTQVDDLNAMRATFLYDQLGRVTQTQRRIDGIDYTMSQTYNALNGVTSETFPDLDGVSYTYDEAGWLSAVSGYIDGPSCYPRCIKYNARAQKDEIDYNNGVVTTFDYFDQDAPGQLLNFALQNRTTNGPSGLLQNLSYTYDDVGNVNSVTDGLFTASRTFSYDDLNRLISGAGAFGTNQAQTSCGYSYDAIGNILNKCGVGYSYNDSIHPSFVTSTSDGKTYNADPNGNTLNGAGRTFVWTVDNRVGSVTNASGTTSMDNDYTGARVKKWGPLGLTIYPFAGYEIGPDGTKTKFFRIGTEIVASKQSPVSPNCDPNSNPDFDSNCDKRYFYHADHLGGTNIITNKMGTRKQLIEYDPWGKVSRSEGNVDPSRRFTGQILDPESGLYYYGARYYDPELGRFISPDSIVPSPGDPQTLNRYSYVRNNPVKYIDPTGHSFWSAIGNFFKNFFRSLPALITGILVGWATWGIGGPILAGILGGMAAAVVNTAINGGNWGMNIGLGALFGGIAGGIGPPIFEGVGGVPSNGVAWSNFLPAVKAGVVVGAALGGLSTAINPKSNFFQNVAFGALGGGMGGAIGFGIVKGATEWWNSMPGTDPETGGSATQGQKSQNMRYLKSEVAGVKIDYKDPSIRQPVDAELAERFETAVAGAKADNWDLNRITITETQSGRTLHQYGLAIDAGRINGNLINGGYGSNPLVTRVVQSLQVNLAALNPYENMGPYIMYTQGPNPITPRLIQQHTTHVHFSIK